jgi:hypothetical protein
LRRLIERSANEGAAHHMRNPLRVYEGDDCQRERIMRARHLTALAIGDNPRAKIIELGCGAADISGAFSFLWHQVKGYDINDTCLRYAAEKYPKVQLQCVELERVTPEPCDVVVLCELLEHLEDPRALVASWLPLAKTCVISHPIDEPDGCGLSAGDHCWSLSEADFDGWFELGGHKQESKELFQMGGYKIAIGLGRNTKES